MKIQLYTSILANGLTKLKKTIKNNTILKNIYECVKIEGTEEGEIILYGENEYFSVKETFSGYHGQTVITPGICVVPYKSIESFVSKCSDDFVTLDDSENVLTITSGEARLHLPSFDPKSYYINIDSNEKDDSKGFGRADLFMTIDAEKLKKMVFYTSYAANRQKNAIARPVLKGIRLRYNDKNKLPFSMMATDSYRLAFAETKIDEDGIAKNTDSSDVSCIIKADVMDYFMSLYEDTDKIIYIAWSSKGIVIQNESDDCVICCKARTIYGTYPKLESLLQKKADLILKVNRDTLLKTFQRANVFKDSKEKGKLNIANICVKTQEVQKRLNIACSVPEIGGMNEEVPTVMISGTHDETISVNGEYITDILKHMDESLVWMHINNKNDSIITEPEPTLNPNERIDVKTLTIPIHIKI